MGHALEEAKGAIATGDVPIGAVVVDASGTVLGRGRNVREALGDPTGHAEVVAVRAAAEVLGTWRLDDCTLVVTLEPCPMCAAAISAARIAVIYYGADDPRMGGVRHGARVFDHAQCHHRPQVHDGIAAAQAGALLREFFRDRR